MSCISMLYKLIKLPKEYFINLENHINLWIMVYICKNLRKAYLNYLLRPGVLENLERVCVIEMHQV